MNVLGRKISATVLGAAMISAPMFSMNVFAAPVAEQQATQNLVKQLTGLHSFSANFSQTTKANGKKLAPKKGLTSQHLNQTFQGVMKVERPGKFFWETTSPSKQTIVTSGKIVWIYDPDLQQAVRQSLSDQVSNTPALLLSGNTSQIMQSYRVTQSDSQKAVYTLTPKAKDSAFQNLSIAFAANGTPTSMVLNDSLGQTTTVSFSQVNKNVTIPVSTFNFAPPKGTDIIDQ
ncbi:outer membrane lipoprotein chaperone LolA [Acinetobacter sp. MD2]|uniref:outer membrane lipoprotein chaperone LolA n=1 Tax=Acinetobacter sp. MD2 TaxID=2600066 RepID=UPI002D1EBC82|nr:outer membrane lipoprotein chaperone LolA [Acinetobacter sp. MD2]MEB3767597.1 outer membrane lipoprotein chaperone LolA [Acinetobacter sp. MD2]